VFLVGAERSGSTLLRLMLDSHEDVTCCEGFEFLAEEISEDGSFPEMKGYHEYLELHPIFGSSQLEVDRTLGYEALVNDFLAQRLTISGKPVVAAMCHEHYSRLLHVWPEARFIHLIRDPRDVARSVMEMGWFGDVDRGIDKWVHAETEWDTVTSRVPQDRWIEIEFADLIADHVGELRRICSFLGVDYSEVMLSYAEETAYGLPDPSRVASWRTNMDPLETAIVEARVGDLLTRRGFEPSGVEPIQLGSLRHRLYRLDGRRRRLETRLRKYGPRLFAEIWLSRLLPTKRYRRSVTLRVNAVERSSRKRSWRADGREITTRVSDADSTPTTAG
jgi:hypothetical protein